LKEEIENIISIIQNNLKKAIKRLRIKTKIKINFIFDWNVKLKRKINIVKGKKNPKNEGQNWHRKQIFWLKGEIERNNKFYKRASKKNKKNQNNDNQIGKHNTFNLNWMMKLKINKTFTKVQK
jgi:hypothetical protein